MAKVRHRYTKFHNSRQKYKDIFSRPTKLKRVSIDLEYKGKIRHTSLRKVLKSQSIRSGGPAYQTMGWTYIHSSAIGFNEDYTALISTYNLMDTINKSCDKTYADNNKLIKKISRLADYAYSHEVLGLADGQKVTAASINNSDLAKLLFKDGLVDRLMEAKKMLSKRFRQITDDDLKSHSKKGYVDKWAGTDHYTKLVNYTAKQFQSLLSMTAGSDYKTSQDNIANFIKTNNNLNQNISSEDYDVIRKNSTVLQGDMGKLFEVYITFLANKFAESRELVKQGTDASNLPHEVPGTWVTSGKSLRLSDVTFEDPTRIFDGMKIGISAKLRLDNNFTISSKMSVNNNWLKLLSAQNVNFFNVLAYLYQNLAALQVFTSRNKVSFSPEDHMRNLMGEIQRFVNLQLLKVGFFGNKNDIGVKVFDPQYMEAVKGKSQGQSVPAFLVTSGGMYDTASVFKYYNEQLKNEGGYINALNAHQHTDSDFNTMFNLKLEDNARNLDILQNAYNSKCQYIYTEIKKAQEKESSTNGLTTYGMLSKYTNQLEIKNYVISAEQLIKTLSNRQASVTFALKAPADYTR